MQANPDKFQAFSVGRRMFGKTNSFKKSLILKLNVKNW